MSYSAEEKTRAVELYIKCGKRPSPVISGLGYPKSRVSLRAWYREYMENDGFLHEGKRSKYTEEQKHTAVAHYLEHGMSVSFTRSELGYPDCRDVLIRWVDELAPGVRKRYRKLQSTYDEKRAAVVALETRSKPAEQIAREAGVDRNALYRWKYELLGKEVPCTMPRNDDILPSDPAELKAEIAALREQVRTLQLHKDILEGTIELLGKDPGADPNRLTNREKTVLIERLRPAYGLKELLAALSIPKSSYDYQVAAMKRPDKYADLRERVQIIFDASKGRYGYRRIWLELRNEGEVVSEKVVARIMREEHLVARNSRKRRKFSSYAGEISEAPENLVRRNFHAEAPNELWLTDITEFHIPAGKVYLSPIIDCFDGMIVSWGVSTSPNAELVNSMLEAAVSTLDEGEAPKCHSDRGSHYRWPGWIDICERNGITRSMSKKGCSPDNSACEGFFGRLKVEFFFGRSWQGWSIEEFMDELDDYIRWYNEVRIKESLGGLSPLRYRERLGLAA